jgi:hypothetical protein
MPHGIVAQNRNSRGADSPAASGQVSGQRDTHPSGAIRTYDNVPKTHSCLTASAGGTEIEAYSDSPLNRTCALPDVLGRNGEREDLHHSELR